MSDIMTTARTMDSREIAELTGKEHRNVCRDIGEQLGKLDGGVLRFEHTYRNEQNGQEYRYYKLPYRETMILVSGYSVELRAKVVDRWMELEAREFYIPRTLPEALRLAADIEEQRKALEEKVRLLAPAAAVADRIANAEGLKTISEIGKINGIGPRKMFPILSDLGVIYRSRGTWVPYQQWIDAGYFEVKEVTYQDGDEIDHLKTQTYVTGKGEVWLAKQFFPAVAV